MSQYIEQAIQAVSDAVYAGMNWISSAWDGAMNGISETASSMRLFLEFLKNDRHYKKYYEAVFILFHTGLRISEFCGLTVGDIDMEHHTINVDKQLQRDIRGKY